MSRDIIHDVSINVVPQTHRTSLFHSLKKVVSENFPDGFMFFAHFKFFPSALRISNVLGATKMISPTKICGLLKRPSGIMITDLGPVDNTKMPNSTSHNVIRNPVRISKNSAVFPVPTHQPKRHSRHIQELRIPNIIVLRLGNTLTFCHGNSVFCFGNVYHYG